jgi:2-polyprenyl-3-methyl-5-hydroxy-6-metoxy-1,4-benzoquinol methylase
VSDVSPTTRGVEYTERLQRKTGAGWKRLLNVQAPYRWNVRRLNLGFTLDVGCGIGRNLGHLDGNGVGVDHNATSIEACRAAGLTAFTTEEFHKSEYAKPDRFDSLLSAHVVEHVTAEQAVEIFTPYLPYVRSGGAVVFITPQERGFKSDATHIRFAGFPECKQLCDDLGLAVRKQYSFPFPRFAGRIFTYNEFITVAGRS